jgi:hypothetical protein
VFVLTQQGAGSAVNRFSKEDATHPRTIHPPTPARPDPPTHHPPTHHAVQPEGAIVRGDDPREEEGREALSLEHVAGDFAGAAEEAVEGLVACGFFGGEGGWLGG